MNDKLDIDKFSLITNIFILSLQFATHYDLNKRIVLEHSFKTLFSKDKELPNYIFHYPDKKNKLTDFKNILKLMDKPISGNKPVLYSRVCDIIDSWKNNFSNEFVEKYV